ncbi:MAG TPA: transposase, partial [Candidatus Limnocylindrales bacterium]|nr:transposase [Candidatus Limnocylindrales bacterium]
APTDATTAAVSTSATTTKTRTRTCWTEQDKKECLALFTQSGLSAADFCRQLGISAATFSLWRRSARSGESPSVAPQFAQVCLTTPVAGVATPEPMAAPAVRIHLPGGMTLEAAVGTDPSWLARLLKAVASA